MQQRLAQLHTFKYVYEKKTISRDRALTSYGNGNMILFSYNNGNDWRGQLDMFESNFKKC